MPFASYRPCSLDQLLSLIEELPPGVKLHAGGTDLMVHLKDARIEPHSVVDLSAIEELDFIARESDTLVIGAMTPFSQLISHAVLGGPLLALREASVLIGSVQIRNRATLAGNICNASPAADTVPPLVVYGAKARIRSSSDSRTVPVLDFITGPGSTVLEAGEFVESVEIPIPKSPSGSAYLRMTRRRSVDLAIVDVAVMIADGRVTVSYGAASARPLRGIASEKLLSSLIAALPAGTEAAGSSTEDPGAPTAGSVGVALDGWDDRAIKGAVEEDISPISDVRGSKEYRSAMAAVLLKRAFTLSLQRRELSKEGAP